MHFVTIKENENTIHNETCFNLFISQFDNTAFKI